MWIILKTELNWSPIIHENRIEAMDVSCQQNAKIIINKDNWLRWKWSKPLLNHWYWSDCHLQREVEGFFLHSRGRLPASHRYQHPVVGDLSSSHQPQQRCYCFRMEHLRPEFRPILLSVRLMTGSFQQCWLVPAATVRQT